MRNTSFASMHCSLAQSLELIGDWWTPLVLRDLYLGLNRFDQFVTDLGPPATTPGTAPTTCPVSNVTAIPSNAPRTARPIVRRVLPGAARTPYRNRVSTRPTVTARTDRMHPSFRTGPQISR